VHLTRWNPRTEPTAQDFVDRFFQRALGSFDETAKKDDSHRIERQYGSFFRSFTLPNRVDSEKVKATFKDGVLHLTVPKTEEVKPRRIAVH
jgi:HSP20 family molecular chaperone IbpA